MQQHKAQAVWDPLEWCMQRKLRETDTVDKFASLNSQQPKEAGGILFGWKVILLK